jgi:hypothetical protein
MSQAHSPEIQALFAQLHTLGVTPEQAAAGVRLHRGDYERPFKRGATAALVPLSEQHPKGRSGHLGQRVEILATDYDSGDGLEVLLETADGLRFWVSHATLKRVEPAV